MDVNATRKLRLGNGRLGLIVWIFCRRFSFVLVYRAVRFRGSILVEKWLGLSRGRHIELLIIRIFLLLGTIDHLLAPQVL